MRLRISNMKTSKIALLLISIVTITACSFSYEKHETHSEYYSHTHFETRDPISSTDIDGSKNETSSSAPQNSQQSSSIAFSSIASSSSQVQSSSSLPISSNSSLALSSSAQASSSSQNQNSSSSVQSSNNSSSSSIEALETTVTFNFFNPSCGSISTEVLNDRLVNYMNEVAGSTLVSSVSNVKSQITNDIPNKGEKVLQIGASSSAGSIEFTFNETIKAITITAQTYHKPYTNYQTGESVPNVDSYSELAISINGQEHTQTVDLKPTDGQPVETQYTTAINASKFKLASVNDEKGRVFIQSMVVIY